MKQTERGIILARSPYSETSLIVTILTELHGIQTFLFQGAKKKKGTVLFPMALVEFSYYRRNDSAMGKMTDVALAEKITELPTNPLKASICFFVVELIQKTQRQGIQESALFHFLWEEAVWLNLSNELANYPCWLLAKYAQFCGIVPSVEGNQPTVFDFLGGKLTTIRPTHVIYCEHPWLHWFQNMLEDSKIVFLSLTIPRDERSWCLDTWLDYYRQHLNGMHEMKSLEIIRTVLHH